MLVSEPIIAKIYTGCPLVLILQKRVLQKLCKIFIPKKYVKKFRIDGLLKKSLTKSGISCLF